MKWASLAFRFLPLVIQAVGSVERLVKGKGPEKQDAAMDVLRTIVETTESGTNRDVFNDAKVEAAGRNLIDAVVAFNNAVTNAKASINPR